LHEKIHSEALECLDVLIDVSPDCILLLQCLTCYQYSTENVLKGVDSDNVAFILLGTLNTTESTQLLNKTFNILIKICEICSAGSGYVRWYLLHNERINNLRWNNSIALDGLNNFKAVHNNPSRFSPILEVIDKTKDIKLHASCFAFVNWIIDSEDDVRIRYELRSELEEADIATITDVRFKIVAREF